DFSIIRVQPLDFEKRRIVARQPGKSTAAAVRRTHDVNELAGDLRDVTARRRAPQSLPVFGSTLTIMLPVLCLTSVCREYLMLSGLAVVVFTYSMPLSSKKSPAIPTDGKRQSALPVAGSKAVSTA